MELSREEFADILKFYRIDDKLEFIGYHEVDPDTFWYFFHDKRSAAYYILEVADYITWVCGQEEVPETLDCYYYPDFSYSFEVKRWLTSHDGLDKTNESGDYEGYMYWANNGYRCVMAEIAKPIAVDTIKKLKTEIAEHDELEIALFKRRFIGAERVSAIPRPQSQNLEELDKNICEIIYKNAIADAKSLLGIGIESLTEEKLKIFNSKTFKYAREWPKETKDIDKRNINEPRLLGELNRQSWLALCELRDFPEYFEERNLLFPLLRRYVRLCGDQSEPKFLPRKVASEILERFDIKSAGELRFHTMFKSAADCKVYIFIDELDTEYALVCRDNKIGNLDQERYILSQESGLEIEQFYSLKTDPEESYYSCNENSLGVNRSTNETEEHIYYFLVGRLQF